MKLKLTQNVQLADNPVWTEDDINEIRERLGKEAILIPVNYAMKEIRFSGWKEVKEEDMETSEYMDLLMRANIGVAMGRMSGNLVAIDCDSTEAYDDWINMNPWLKDTLLTQGQPGRGTFWIRIMGKYPAQNVNIGGYGEWRAGHGSQTVFAGIHPKTQAPYKIVKDKPVLAVASDQIKFPDKIKANLNCSPLEPDSTDADTDHVVDALSAHSENRVAYDSPPVTHHTDCCIEERSTVQKEGEGGGSSIASIQYPKESTVPTDPKDRESMLVFFEREMPKNGHGQPERALDLYWKMVGQRYPAKEESRNRMLVNFSMTAVTAIDPRLATLFMSMWYCTTKARGKWKESYNSHMRKFLDAITARIEEYPGRLRNLSPKFTNEELAVYKELSGSYAVAYRIMRNLALQQGERDGTFPMGQAQLEMRLMMYCGFAFNVFNKFQAGGIIRKLKKGEVYQTGQPPRATVWAYLLAGPLAQGDDDPF